MRKANVSETQVTRAMSRCDDTAARPVVKAHARSCRVRRIRVGAETRGGLGMDVCHRKRAAQVYIEVVDTV